MTAPRPTSPQPNTTQVEPARTSAVYSAAPIPVERPHANGAQPSSDASGETFARAISGITVYSANVDVPMKCRIGAPSRERRVVPSGRWPSPCWSRIATHRFVRPLRQWTHSPHSGAKRVMTWSPGDTSVTSAPMRSTTPAPSWPRTHGAYPVGSAPDAV